MTEATAQQRCCRLQQSLLSVLCFFAHMTLMASYSIANETCWTMGPSQFADAMHYCVSSQLPPQGRYRYGPKNLEGFYGSNGAWCEGVRGHGVGETITVRIDRGPAFRRLAIRNGYGNSRKSFHNNGRLKRIRITSDTGINTIVELVDQAPEQPVYLPIVAPHRWIRIEILGVYPGRRWSDTCVSQLTPDFVYEEELRARGRERPPKPKGGLQPKKDDEPSQQPPEDGSTLEDLPDLK